jgi:pyruvate,water dikinase
LTVISIGSNDLTQLALGLDRDSRDGRASFDERNGAVEKMVAWPSKPRSACGKKIGICGQAPSDYPEFAEFLVKRASTRSRSIPDTVIQTTHHILETEKALKNKKPLSEIITKLVITALAITRSRSR